VELITNTIFCILQCQVRFQRTIPFPTRIIYLLLHFFNYFPYVSSASCEVWKTLANRLFWIIKATQLTREDCHFVVVFWIALFVHFAWRRCRSNSLLFGWISYSSVVMDTKFIDRKTFNSILKKRKIYNSQRVKIKLIISKMDGTTQNVEVCSSGNTTDASQKTSIWNPRMEWIKCFSTM